MQMIILIYDEAIDDHVMATMHRVSQECGCECHYTKVRHAEGAGITGVREGTWRAPGENNLIFCAADETQIQALTAALKEMESNLEQAHGPRPYLGMKMIVVPGVVLI